MLPNIMSPVPYDVTWTSITCLHVPIIGILIPLLKECAAEECAANFHMVLLTYLHIVMVISMFCFSGWALFTATKNKNKQNLYYYIKPNKVLMHNLAERRYTYPISDYSHALYSAYAWLITLIAFSAISLVAH